MRSLILALIFLCLTHAAARAAGLDAPDLDALVRSEGARGFSGVVLVTRGDAVLLDKAYGAERGVTVERGSRFWVASISKQFASAAILKNAEQGRLTLDDPLARFFPAAPEDKRNITIRQLLAHLSGFDQNYDAETAADRDAAAAAILSVPLIDKPGAKFHYANNNYKLAAAIVEKVSGRDFHDYVREDLWRPAGLKDTGFSGDNAARVAPARGETPPRLQQRMWGEAGVYMSAADLIAWYRALREGRVLSRAGVETLFAPVAPIGEGQTALGWFIGKTAQGTRTIFTRGSEDFGANTLIYAYADGTIIVIFSHAGMADPDTSWSRAVLRKLEAVLAL